MTEGINEETNQEFISKIDEAYGYENGEGEKCGSPEKVKECIKEAYKIFKGNEGLDNADYIYYLARLFEKYGNDQLEAGNESEAGEFFKIAQELFKKIYELFKNKDKFCKYKYFNIFNFLRRLEGNSKAIPESIKKPEIIKNLCLLAYEIIDSQEEVRVIEYYDTFTNDPNASRFDYIFYLALRFEKYGNDQLKDGNKSEADKFFEKAQRLFEIAAEVFAKHPESCKYFNIFNLARRFKKGKGVGKDPDIAQKLFEAAYESITRQSEYINKIEYYDSSKNDNRSETDCVFYLARRFEKCGKLKEAKQLFDIACDVYKGCYKISKNDNICKLARRFKRGIGVEKNSVKAKELFEIAEKLKNIHKELKQKEEQKYEDSIRQQPLSLLKNIGLSKSKENIVELFVDKSKSEEKSKLKTDKESVKSNGIGVGIGGTN